VLVIVGLFMRGATGQDAGASSEPTSPAAQQARKEYESAVAKAEAELAAARKVYTEKLDAALKAAMAAGDLPEANRIDALRKAASDTPARPAAATAAKGNPAAKPGWIVGTVADARGKPIPGVQFEVVAFGTTIQGGQRAEFRLEVDENGRF